MGVLHISRHVPHAESQAEEPPAASRGEATTTTARRLRSLAGPSRPPSPPPRPAGIVGEIPGDFPADPDAVHDDTGLVPLPAVPSASDASSYPADRPGRTPVPLARLAGVRPEDMAGEGSRARRTRPRLMLKPAHMLAVMLLLIVTTCASLSLLVQQAIHYETVLAAAGSAGNGTHADRPQTDEPDGDTFDDTTEDGSGDTGRHADQETDDGLIDLNTATSEELQTIRGIGPVTAASILEHRRRIGRFDSVDQLLDVSGIGQKTLDKIRSQVTVR